MSAILRAAAHDPYKPMPTTRLCYATRDEGSIWALFVQPGHEGKGLARRLLGTAAEWIFQQGHAIARLDTTAHTRADRFYARQGWQRKALSDTQVEFTLPRPPR